MDFRVFVEPQLHGATYAQQLAAARVAEDLRFDGFFRSDHYLPFGPGNRVPGPTDSWLTLAGIARETRSIRIGTLVSAATLRHPASLAVQVAQVDDMSDGRVELGLGAGSHADEHLAYGIPFPTKRFGALEEQLQIITRLWSTPPGSAVDFDGETFRLKGAPALPTTRQRPHPPLIVGGRGRHRTPMLAARYANEFNVGMVRPEQATAHFAWARSACDQIERDPAGLICSVALVVCCGSTEAEVTARAHRIERGTAELRATGLAGSPAEVTDKIGRYVDAGVQRFYLQVLDMVDYDHLELLSHQVLSQITR